MKTPFFSVVLPTKNRSFLVELALRSLVRQSFDDFEVVLIDNDDTDATRAVVERFSDPRIKYFRTGGLSMPDNWEFGFTQAQGEYIGILEDKQALKGRALERIHQIVQAERPDSVMWGCDTYDDSFDIPRLRLQEGTGAARWKSSDDLLAAFLGSPELNYKSILPLPQRGCMHRALAKRIREGPMKRLCPPVAPDIQLAISQLALGDGVLTIDAAFAIYTSTRHSNGRSFGLKDQLSRQFTKELGGNPSVYFHNVPVKAATIPGTIYNDYLTSQRIYQGRLAKHPINWSNYFIQCRVAMRQSINSGVDMSVEMAEWDRALTEQATDVQHTVLDAKNVEKSGLKEGVRSMAKHLGNLIQTPRLEKKIKSWYKGNIKGHPEWRFRNAMEYLEWEHCSPGDSNHRR